MSSDLDGILSGARKLRTAIQASKSVNVNRVATRESASSLVQTYFRSVRAEAIRYSDATKIASLDDAMQRLLTLTNGRNAKTSYLVVLARINSIAAAVNFDFARGRSDEQATRVTDMSAIEDRIYQTLTGLVASAAESYRQAIADLGTERYSYRGPATDLREALREVLNHIAPDQSVMVAPGYKQEPGVRGPTMAQKMRFIMRQRAKSDSLAKPALDATDLVDTMTSRIVRSTYVSGSINVHVLTNRAEVQQLKLHVDSALAQLLEIFH